MAVITKITQQKRDSERFNIFLDGEYSFSVHESVLVQFGLTKGMELDDWALGELQYENEINKAFNRALHFLSFRMRSEKEIVDKLKKEEYGDAVILEAIVKLKRLNFVNDEQFAEAFMKTKIQTTKLGPQALKREMNQKGIARDIQDDLLSTYNEAEQFDIAKNLAEKVARKNERQASLQVKRKIESHLLRKGYSYDMIRNVLEEIDLDRDEDEWSAIVEREGEKAWNRISRKYSGRDLHYRVKQNLYSKGIPMEVIQEFIEMKENEDD